MPPAIPPTAPEESPVLLVVVNVMEVVEVTVVIAPV